MSAGLSLADPQHHHVNHFDEIELQHEAWAGGSSGSAMFVSPLVCV
jgi:hypothetical protein